MFTGVSDVLKSLDSLAALIREVVKELKGLRSDIKSLKLSE